MADELRGVEVRLERAHEHVDALRHESRMFMMEFPQPYRSAIDDEPVNGDYIVRARVSRNPPVRLGMLAADAVHNIRAALDMLAWELALKSETPPDETDRTTAFPLCMKPEDWNAWTTKRALQNVHRDAIPLIELLQPYHGGELLRLGFVAAVDNWAKHHAIPHLLTFRISGLQPISAHRLVHFIDKAFEDGDEIARVRKIEPAGNLEQRYQALIRCHVAYAKGWPGDGMPLDTIELALKVVRDRVLPAFVRFFPDSVLAAVHPAPPDDKDSKP